MTCREFQHAAASLTLSELSRAQDKPLVEHADGCPQCGAWMQQQRLLAASLQALRAQTASLEAGPNVERALLQTFRQGSPEVVQPAALRFTPVAMRLSRFFDVGAYVAVAAALVVAMVLGVGLWRHRSVGQPVQSQPAPATTAPISPNTTAAVSGTPRNVAPPADELAGKSARHMSAVRRASAAISEEQSAASLSQADSDPDYMALMLCDPLSCSGDEQLVRMELPASSATGLDSPQIADVVVGYDGAVRAVRIVN